MIGVNERPLLRYDGISKLWICAGRNHSAANKCIKAAFREWARDEFYKTGNRSYALY